MSVITKNAGAISSFLVYCLSSGAMLLVNKKAVLALPLPFTLVLFQNVTTFIFIFLLGIAVPSFATKLEVSKMKLWFPVAALFTVMLYTSLAMLSSLTVPTVTVFRNLSTFLIAIADYKLLGKATSPSSAACIGVMIVGSVVYGQHDLAFDLTGYSWLGLNIVATGANFVYGKWVTSVGGFTASAFGCSYYNNFLSIPMLLTGAYATGELPVVASSLQTLSVEGLAYVFASCVLGFCLSCSSYALQKAVNVTSFTVANNFNKVASVLVSKTLFADQFVPGMTVGLVTVMAGGAAYSVTKMGGPSPKTEEKKPKKSSGRKRD